MRRSKIFTINLKDLKPHLPIILCFSVFIIGLVLGSLFVGNFDYAKEYFSSSLEHRTDIRIEGNITNIFFDSFKGVIPLYLFVFLFGTSVVGCAMSPLILLWYGFSYGSISGILYSSYDLEGIMCNAIIFIPSVLFCAFGLSLLVRDAVSFSYLLSGICIKANKPINIYSNFKSYCLRGIISFIFAVVSIVFDVVMSSLFIKYFNFLT